MTTCPPGKIKLLIEDIIKKDCYTKHELLKLLKNTKLSFADIKSFENFNHHPDESYGRHVLFNSPKLEVVVMSWNTGDYTSIHDHGSTQWGAVVCFGQIEHTCFELQNQRLCISNKDILTSNEICLVSNKLIHQMGNPFKSPAMTLHIYGTDHCATEVTASAKNYDPLQNKVHYANGGAFLELPDKMVTHTAEGPLVQGEIFHTSAKILLNYKIKQNRNYKQLAKKKYS